jgi:hypothetical protein
MHRKYFHQKFVIGMQFRFKYLIWSDVFVFFACALEIEQTMGRKAQWFVSSDSEENSAKIRDLYPDRVFQANGSIGHVQLQDEAYERALLDIELLSLCDEFIMTGGSTFGFMAAIKSDKYPLFVNGGLNATKCERFSLTNPSITTDHDAVF